jgi:hypothetical protein
MLPPLSLEPIRNDDLQQTLISDPADDATYRVGAQIERALIDPTTGGRRSARSVNLLRTDDGWLIADPTREPIYACRACHRHPLSARAVRACSRCQSIVCASCARSFDNQPYCPPCGAGEERSRRWRFLFSIT